MSTRSAVAIPTAAGWKGRYVHSDGYPSWTGKRVHDLVNRDGYNTVVETIVTGDNFGWSGLDLEITEVPSYKDDGRFAVIPGYGTAYTTVDNQSMESDWVTEKDDWGTEWVYVLGETGIDVYTMGRECTKVGHVRYDENVSAMDDIEKAVYTAM